ncbi:MAG: CocE/NonD family hydrolase [Bacteroidia bacterium]|nr:CocE/NonD family hydrolase [Bacteroidia bacterium]
MMKKLLFYLILLSFGRAFSQKISKPGEYKGYFEANYKPFHYHSNYISTPDSVLLAIDWYIPKNAKPKETFPTILFLTRYARSLEIRPFWKILRRYQNTTVDIYEVKHYVKHGYVVVVADMRGSGASTGCRNMEFSPQEVKDMNVICDWIIKQPWSNGKIGATGDSYVGTTADLLTINHHPAVKCVVPRSSIYDLYADISMPGGLRHGAFIDIWGKTTQALDKSSMDLFGKKAKTFIKGVRPVETDKNRTIFSKAQQDHTQNFNIINEKIDFSDQKHPKAKLSFNDCSPHYYSKEISTSMIPQYRITGWYDGGLPFSAVKAFNTQKNPQKLLIGPWDHLKKDHVSPHGPMTKHGWDVELETVRYFDYYLKGIDNGIATEPKVHYYVMGAEVWKSSNEFPPQNMKYQTWYTNENLLTKEKSNTTGKIIYDVDYEIGTGNSSRWNSLTGLYKHGMTRYENRDKIASKLVVFDSPALEKELEIVGNPMVELCFASDTKDAGLFVYLEEVLPDGSVKMITEGQLRGAFWKEAEEADYQGIIVPRKFESRYFEWLTPHKETKTRIEMIPTAFQFGIGSKIRLSIAGADADHFDPVEFAPQQLTIFWGNNGTCLHLPVVESQP